jgi:hypothetical protein
VDLKYAQFLTLYGLFEANRWRESQGRNTAAKQKQEGEADNLTCVIWKEKWSTELIVKLWTREAIYICEEWESVGIALLACNR